MLVRLDINVPSATTLKAATGLFTSSVCVTCSHFLCRSRSSRRKQRRCPRCLHHNWNPSCRNSQTGVGSKTHDCPCSRPKRPQQRKKWRTTIKIHAVHGSSQMSPYLASSNSRMKSKEFHCGRASTSVAGRSTDSHVLEFCRLWQACG